ncbi:hypothetical protein HYT32_01505 [Candidatus Roizmanbacteria bacterium]|nr:hypothetical protein [Candidatus Roizmanbacteria bacterium]
MARIFLDANILIDIVEKRKDMSLDDFNNHEVYISPLSIHILFYVIKKKLPFPRLSDILSHINIVSLSIKITENALSGPTTDFEDNVQLHSGTEAECDLSLIEDKNLLN